MEPYNKKYIPPPIGSNNTGAICWLNSLMQSLLSSPIFVKKIMERRHILEKTEVGSALYNIVSCAFEKQDKFPLTIGNLQRKMVKSLHKFGMGQECVTEGLTHLLDLISDEPLSKLFTYRTRCYLFCNNCKILKKNGTDYGITINLFHLEHPIASDKDFLQHLRFHNSISDMKCDCGHYMHRRYYLTMIPEIIVVVFNKFNTRAFNHIPTRLCLDGVDNQKLEFVQIAQIEHHGTMHGGHYFAKCLRSDNRVYLMNDSSVSSDKFSPTNNTYIVIYNFKKYN